jgi:hypothetical protein
MADSTNETTSTVPPQRDPRQPADFDPVPLARHLVRSLRLGALATLDATGDPLATLTSVATDYDGAPLILVSQLSTHTQNLQRDPRASLLLSQGGKGDPLAHPRVSLQVRARRLEGSERERCRGRYLARLPKAQLYADFPDFSFWRLEPHVVHLNGGFARAWDGPWSEIATDLTGAEALVALATDAVDHMNEDHADALVLYATKLCGMPPGPWRASGVDPDGLDLSAGDLTARLPFPRRILDGGALRLVLKDLADSARATP